MLLPLRLLPKSRRKRAVAPIFSLLMLIGSRVVAGEVEDAETLLMTGKYEEALATAKGQVANSPGAANWSRIAGAAMTALGQYQEARETLASGITQNPVDLRLR